MCLIACLAVWGLDAVLEGGDVDDDAEVAGVDGTTGEVDEVDGGAGEVTKSSSSSPAPSTSMMSLSWSSAMDLRSECSIDRTSVNTQHILPHKHRGQ